MTYNVDIMVSMDEAEKLVEILNFKVEVQKDLIDFTNKRLTEADDGHGNPKEYLAKRLNEITAEYKTASYLLSVVRGAIKDSDDTRSGPF